MARTVSSAKRTAEFKCSDRLLDRIWEEGAATLASGSEELPLTQARVHALASCYVCGEAKPVEATAQSADDDPVRDHGLVWVMMLKDYSDYTASNSVLMSFFPKVEQLMSEWYPSRAGENGLFGEGRESAAENAIYYGALLGSAELAARARDFAAAREWRERAEQVRIGFNRRLWDERKGVCADREEGDGLSDGVSERANYLAILFGVVDEARAARILEYLDSSKPLVDRGEEPADLYVLEALAKVGRYQQALNLIRQDWSKSPSPTPVYWLMKYVAGIRLPDAEHRTPYLVDPQLCDLEWVKARMGALYINR